MEDAMNKKIYYSAVGNINAIANMYVGNAAGEATASFEGEAFDVLCALKCVGSNVIECIKCGTDLSCWKTCARPQVGSCISSCF